MDKKGCVQLRVIDENKTGELLYISPLTPAVFIENDKGKEVRFIGIQPNMPPLELKDYIKIQPGGRHWQEFSVNFQYDLVDAGWYSVELSGNYFDPEGGGFYKWPPARAKFYYGGHCIFEQEPAIR